MEAISVKQPNLPVSLRTTWMLVFLSQFPILLWGYNAREDSLLRVLQTLPQDTQRVLMYNELFKATFTSEPQKALDYAQKALHLARVLDYQFGIARLSHNIGLWHSKRGNYTEALRFYQESHSMLELLGDTLDIADCDMNMGSVHYKRGDYPRALAQYRIALEGYRALGDTIRILDAVNNMGSVYKEQGSYPEALQAYMAALHLRERLADPIQEAISCANVGAIYQLEGSLDEAMAFFERALRLSTAGNDQFGRVAALTSIAEIHMERGRLSQAGPLLAAARSLATEIDDQFGLATALLGLANLHDLENRADSAALCYGRALEICRSIGRTQGVAIALNHIGRLGLGEGRWRAAEEALAESLRLSDSLAALDLSRDNHRLLAEVYALKGDHARAYLHQKRFFALHDSLHSSEKTQQIAEMQARYDAQAKEDEINRLRLKAAEDALRIARSSRRNLVLLAILLPVLLLALFFFLRYLQKQRHNRRIEEKNVEIRQQHGLLETRNRQILDINVGLEATVEARTQALRIANEELDTFLYQSAHALRRPLLRVEGLLQLMDSEVDAEARLRLRERLGQNLGEMDGLLHQLIHVSESNQRRLKLETVRLAELVEEALPADVGETECVLDVAPDQKVVTDRYLLTALLGAVVDNAFRFQDSHKEVGRVTVRVEEREEEVALAVVDNGLGIGREQLPRVCDMFYRGGVHSQGNGLGLYLARKICAKLNGRLELASELGVGTEVRVFLPK